MRTIYHLICFCAAVWTSPVQAAAFPFSFWQPPASAGPTTFTDNFTRSNENPLSDSGAWTSGVTGTANLQVLANVCVSTGSNAFQFVSTPAFTANQKATITIGAVLSGIGPMVRVSSGGAGYVLYLASATSLQIYRVAGGSSFNSVGSSYTITAVVAGNTIGLGIVGSTLTPYVNGAAQSTQTDSTVTTGGPGAFSNSTSAAISLFQAITQ